jgi:hypothetical protein
MTSDGGGLLLREVGKRTGIIERFAGCFRDHRDGERIEHTVRELVEQRVYGLALGCEDLNDHDQLRRDPMLAVLAEKYAQTGTAARVFKEFEYQTRESWSRARLKAEHLEKGSNPRFVVMSLLAESWEARRLYEELYYARRDGEPRQGTADAICGPDEHSLSEKQPDPVVFFLDCLCTDGSAASAGSGGHGVGSSVGYDDSIEGAENCGADSGDGAGRRPRLHFRGLLRLYSRYGPQGCSATRSGLCHKAPAQSVTGPSRLSATRLADNYLGGTFTHR